jgi:hypothetical protein
LQYTAVIKSIVNSAKDTPKKPKKMKLLRYLALEFFLKHHTTDFDRFQKVKIFKKKKKKKKKKAKKHTKKSKLINFFIFLHLMRKRKKLRKG